MSQSEFSFQTRILRKHHSLPRYIGVNPEFVEGRTVSFRADVLLDGAGPFERNIRPWGKGSDVFFSTSPNPNAKKQGCKPTIHAP